MPNPKENPMGVSNFEPNQSVYKDEVISAAEALMINCHHLASDILDLAQKEACIEPGYARTVSRQLSEWAGQLAAAVQTISRKPGDEASTVTSCS